MKIKKKFNFKIVYIFFVILVLIVFLLGISANADELQTETRYIYGTCVEADGITSGVTDWTYGVISSRKYYSNVLQIGRSNTYWILPQGYLYYPSSSIGDTGGYCYGIPSNGVSLEPVVAGEPIDATSSTVYVIFTSKSGTCSAINFSYEYVLSDDPDDPDNPDNPDDPDNPDNPDNPPVYSGDYSKELYEIRVLLACILCVNIINLFNRRIRDGYT